MRVRKAFSPRGRPRHALPSRHQAQPKECCRSSTSDHPVRREEAGLGLAEISSSPAAASGHRDPSMPPSSSSTSCRSVADGELAQVKTSSSWRPSPTSARKSRSVSGTPPLRPHARRREPFASSWATTSSAARIPCMKQLLDVFDRLDGRSSPSSVPRGPLHQYVVIAGRNIRRERMGDQRSRRESAGEERPPISPSIGRYLLTPDLFGIPPRRPPTSAARSSSPTGCAACQAAADVRRRVPGQALRHGRQSRFLEGDRGVRPSARTSRRLRAYLKSLPL